MWKRGWGRKPGPTAGEEAGGTFTDRTNRTKRTKRAGGGPPPRTEEEEALLDRIAKAVVRRSMTAPAIFLLESSKPLSFLGSQFLHFLSPIVHSVLDARELDRLAVMLERRDTVEELIRRIEDAEAATTSGATTERPRER